MHSSHILLSYTPLIHSSHTLLSYTPLIHSSHTLLSTTPLIHRLKLWAADEYMGKIVAVLKQKKMYEHTLVFYTAGAV
jgi:hypothetical protein